MKAGFTVTKPLFDLRKLWSSLYQAFCKMMALWATCRNTGTFSRYKHFGKKTQVLMGFREKNTEAEIFKTHTFGFRHFLSRPQPYTLGYKLLNPLGF